ncbi:MAG: efflux RND transporter periplasmic adaptor subunit [Ignavibacteriales bacterium]|nr:MAG: efflux RND transporter periplasmic adaptor subunit [Ignavibacteriales bacterium]
MDRKIEKKNWTPKKIIITGLGSVFIIVVLYNFVLGDKSTRLNVDNEKITIGSVKYEPFQEFIPITGTVQPIQTFFLDVSDGGRVVERFVEEGAFVNAGDPIVKFDNAQLTLSIIYNEANVFQQINSLRSTRLAFEQNKLNLQGQLLDLDYQILERKRVYENNTKLFEKNLISKNEYDLSKDQFEYMVRKKALTMETYRQDSIFRAEQINQLEISVQQLQQNLGVTKTQLENLTVRAPIKGQLTSLRAEIGQSISPGQNLGQIDVIDSFKVRASIDEHYIARVNPGQTGEFTFAGETYNLIIKTVYPQVANGRFEVDMHFTGTVPTTIRRGQTLQIRLELGELSNALTVERGGFYQTTGGQWIFVVDNSGDFAIRRDIKLGRQNSQVFEVLEGLKEGEKVVTSSYENYRDIEKLVLK